MSKVHIATMQGCGHCDAAKAELGDHPDFNIVECHGPNAVSKDHPDRWVCEGVTGFPTFKTDDRQVCAKGFGGKDAVMESCSK